jgi:hypothetical protein
MQIIPKALFWLGVALLMAAFMTSRPEKPAYEPGIFAIACFIASIAAKMIFDEK